MSCRTRITRVLAAAVAAGAIAAPSASAADEIQTAPFNIAGMAQNIESRLGGVTGYAYAIAKDGKIVAAKADGKARQGADGNLDMTTWARMEIWSATKTYTAAATLRLLEAHPDANLKSAVAPYLPAGWIRGAGFDSQGVTFEQLLNHTSGLGQVGDNLMPAEINSGVWNTTWSGNQYAVQKGTTPGQGYNYTNMNYALLRVLNARLARDLDPTVPVQTASNTGQINLNYINRDLLEPAGIGARRCEEIADSVAVLHYNPTAPLTSNGALVELNGTSAEACAGHRGLHMSAVDMARFMIALSQGTIVSANVRKQMDDGRFGWSNNSNNSNAQGVFWHGGDGFVGNGREGHTCQMKFPNNMQATLIINSALNGVGTTQCGVLLQAWQNATQ